MNFLSKDSSLEESIKKMKIVLSDADFEVDFSQQKHPLQNCYSVNLTSKKLPNYIYSNGKGILSDASTASALGEFIERVQTNNFFIDFYLPQRKSYPDEVVLGYEDNYLSDELLEIYNPSDELCGDDLVDFNSDYEDKIVALPFIKHSSKEKVFFPVNILSNLYVSNGLASGNTSEEARVQALSEIFERYAKIEIIKNGYSLPKFPKEIIKSFDKVYKDIEVLREQGYIVEVLDASLGGKFPVTAISLIKNSTLFVSFGSHPILEVSLERTMTELMQGRSLDDLDVFETPTFDMSIVADSFNLESHFIDSTGKLGFAFLSSTKSFEYAPFTYDGNCTVNEYDFLMDILKKMDKESYIREYDYLGFYSCQILVPSISEVYPISDLIYNNKNNAKLIRDMVLNFENYDPEDILDEIEQLEDTLDVEKYIGVIFENNFTVREFKAQMHLLLFNKDEALELLEFGTSKIGLIVSELIKMQKQGCNFKEYEEGLINIFTKDNLKKAKDIFKNRKFLIDVSLHQDYHNMLEIYDNLGLKKNKFS
ncbi:MAG: YcaO-like family protein [Campylobacterota bacterium]|nr:YcaO-like family protein [Campylobacterota bacterium]